MCGGFKHATQPNRCRAFRLTPVESASKPETPAKSLRRQRETRCAPCCARGSARTSTRAGSRRWSSRPSMDAWCAPRVPVKFLKNWIQSHYADDLLQCCAAEFTGVERVDVILRQPGLGQRPRDRRRRRTRRARHACAAKWRARTGRGAARRRQPRTGRNDGAHARQRLRGLAARSALHVRQLRRRSGQPHGACRRDPGGRNRAGRGARLQSALPPLPTSGSARPISSMPSPGR